MSTDLLQFLCTIFNIASYLVMAAGAPRAGFIICLCAQPFWFLLGRATGMRSLIALACFYVLVSVWGVFNENNKRHHRYGDAVEAVLWFFKIGWEPCDNYGVYWNKRLKRLKGVNDL